MACTSSLRVRCTHRRQDLEQQGRQHCQGRRLALDRCGSLRLVWLHGGETHRGERRLPRARGRKRGPLLPRHRRWLAGCALARGATAMCDRRLEAQAAPADCRPTWRRHAVYPHVATLAWQARPRRPRCHRVRRPLAPRLHYPPRRLYVVRMRACVERLTRSRRASAPSSALTRPATRKRARPRDSDAWRLARRPSPASSSPRVSCVPLP